MINQDVRYATVLIQELGEQQGTIQEISKKYGISKKFLELVAGKLRRAGLLIGSRGRHGGYVLTRRAVSMLDLLRALGREPKALWCSLTEECKGGAMCTERELEAKMVGKMNDLFVRMAI